VELRLSVLVSSWVRGSEGGALTCRHVRSVRDEDAAVYRSCTFLGNFAALALGTHSGEIRLHDTLSGDLIDTIDAHDTPAYQLRVQLHQPPPQHHSPLTISTVMRAVSTYAHFFEAEAACWLAGQALGG
jgi:hypothetical protein